MRKIYLVRHGATDGTRHNRADYGSLGAELSNEGILQAKQIVLPFSIDATVASSPMTRALQTAQNAGFDNTIEHSSLSEINTDLHPDELDGMLRNGEVPEIAVQKGKEILANLPTEDVWFTHGMTIAAIKHVLQIKDDNFVPPLGSVTIINVA